MAERRSLYIPGPAQSMDAFTQAVAEGDLEQAERWARLLFAVVEAEIAATELEEANR